MSDVGTQEQRVQRVFWGDIIDIAALSGQEATILNPALRASELLHHWPPVHLGPKVATRLDKSSRDKVLELQRQNSGDGQIAKTVETGVGCC